MLREICEEFENHCSNREQFASRRTEAFSKQFRVWLEQDPDYGCLAPMYGRDHKFAFERVSRKPSIEITQKKEYRFKGKLENIFSQDVTQKRMTEGRKQELLAKVEQVAWNDGQAFVGVQCDIKVVDDKETGRIIADMFVLYNIKTEKDKPDKMSVSIAAAKGIMRGSLDVLYNLESAKAEKIFQHSFETLEIDESDKQALCVSLTLQSTDAIKQYFQGQGYILRGCRFVLHQETISYDDERQGLLSS